MLDPSRRLRGLTLSAYVATALVLVLMQPTVWGAALVVLLGTYALSYGWRQFALDSPSRVSGVRFDGHGWGLLRGGRWQRATLLSPVFCHRHLLVLRLRPDGARWAVALAITDDSCSADGFRRLRVLARHLPAPRLWAASR